MLRRVYLWCTGLALCILCQCQKPTVADGPARAESDRSPIDIALLADGHAVVAHHTADAIALVDLATGAILAEAAAGRKPAAVAAAPDGKRVAVSNHWSHDVCWFDVQGDKLVKQATIPVGNLPRGVLFS